MLELKTEHLFDSRATVKPFSEWMAVGDGGWGFRLIVPVNEGTVEGPKKYSSTAGWLWVGMVRCAVNGTKAYIPYYEEDPS